MKNLKLFLNINMFILLFAAVVFAQQDYQIVQNFQKQYQEIEQSIKDADSLAQLDQFQEEIDSLQNKFQANKDLLDKGLYPEDFNSSISKLRNELALRRKDFTQITTLKTQVSQLNIELDTLNSKNANLLNRVQELEMQGEKNARTIADLKRNISALMLSMHKRDNLIMNMLDTLIPAGIREKAKLTEQEKQNVYKKAQKENAISNIKRAIQDNIKFLHVTNLTPNDLNNIKNQEHDFEMLWQKIGPKITAVYSEKGKNAKDLEEINSDFNAWRDALTQETWNSVRQVFSVYNINLEKFSNGKEFTNTVGSYINDEIKNAKLKGKNAEKSYTIFADSAWFGNVKPKWVPYLVDNNMLTNAQKDTIETKIANWKDAAYPNNLLWLYILIGIVIIVVIIFLARRKPRNKTQA
jgi:hypothetical protein